MSTHVLSQEAASAFKAELESRMAEYPTEPHRPAAPAPVIDEARQTLTIDGVTFSLSMLKDFIAALRPGARIGPVFLERKGNSITVHTMDVVDVEIIHRCQRGEDH